MTRLLCPLALLLLAPVARAADGPTAEFALADGWVNVRLHKDGEPISDAKLVVLVGAEVWAEGELDGGKGTFPKPTTPTCQVVFIYPNGTSAPVPLTFTGDALTPPSAVVGGVLPACCSPTSSDLPPPDRSAERSLNRQRLGVFAAVLLVGGLVGVWAFRRATRPGSSSGEMS